MFPGVFVFLNSGCIEVVKVRLFNFFGTRQDSDYFSFGRLAGHRIGMLFLEVVFLNLQDPTVHETQIVPSFNICFEVRDCFTEQRNALFCLLYRKVQLVLRQPHGWLEKILVVRPRSTLLLNELLYLRHSLKVFEIVIHELTLNKECFNDEFMFSSVFLLSGLWSIFGVFHLGLKNLQSFFRQLRLVLFQCESTEIYPVFNILSFGEQEGSDQHELMERPKVRVGSFNSIIPHVFYQAFLLDR